MCFFHVSEGGCIPIHRKRHKRLYIGCIYRQITLYIRNWLNSNKITSLSKQFLCYHKHRAFNVSQIEINVYKSGLTTIVCEGKLAGIVCIELNSLDRIVYASVDLNIPMFQNFMFSSFIRFTSHSSKYLHIQMKPVNICESEMNNSINICVFLQSLRLILLYSLFFRRFFHSIYHISTSLWNPPFLFGSIHWAVFQSEPCYYMAILSIV